MLLDGKKSLGKYFSFIEVIKVVLLRIEIIFKCSILKISILSFNIIESLNFYLTFYISDKSSDLGKD